MALRFSSATTDASRQVLKGNLPPGFVYSLGNSVAMWVRPRVQNSNNKVSGGIQVEPTATFCFRFTGSTVSYQRKLNGSGYANTASQSGVKIGDWNLVIGVRETQNKCSLNGSPYSLGSNNFDTGAPAFGWMIGALDTETNNFKSGFDGDVAYMFAFDRTPTEGEITALWNRHHPRAVMGPSLKLFIEVNGQRELQRDEISGQIATEQINNPRKREAFSFKAARSGMWFPRLVTGTIAGPSQVNADFEARWNVRENTPANADLRWGLRNTLDKQSITQWNVHTNIPQTTEFRWNERVFISKNIDLQWFDQQLVDQDGRFDWALRNLVLHTAGFGWNDHQNVVLDTESVWALRSFVDKTADGRWNARSLADRSSDFHWNKSALVTRSSELLWDVLSQLSIQAGVTLQWMVRELTSQSSTQPWDILQNVDISQQIDLRWDLQQLASTISELRWNDRRLIDNQLNAKWHDYKLAASQLGGKWHNRELIGSNPTLMWHSRVLVDRGVDLEWVVRKLVESDFDIEWVVRQLTGGDVNLDWNLLSLTALSPQFHWRLGDVTYLKKNIQRFVVPFKDRRLIINPKKRHIRF